MTPTSDILMSAPLEADRLDQAVANLDPPRSFVLEFELDQVPPPAKSMPNLGPANQIREALPTRMSGQRQG